MTTRRRFIAVSTAAAGAGLLSMAGASAFAQAMSGAQDMASSRLLARTIPSTGESIPVIGAGTSGSFEVAVGSAEYEALKKVLKLFFDGGARVIDTSPNYGAADAVLGQLLEEGGWRERCFLATKIAADSLADAQAQWAESLRKLRTDRVELLQVHNLRDWKTQLPYARELKAQGKVRHVGVTHFMSSGLPELEQILRTQTLDFIQIQYSVNAPQAAERIFPLAREKGVAVMINRAFDDGRLFAKVAGKPLPEWAGEAGISSWAQLFLKFAISHPAVTCVIPATGKPERQADQLKAGAGPLLTQQQQDELITAFA